MSEHLPQSPSMQALVVIEEAVPLADSREIAFHLHIEHRSFFRLIVTYQEEIEVDFGKVRFEIAPSGKTNQPQKYALLTEDQTYAYMSYSQNTAQARACKRLLVKAFAEARHALEQIKEQQRQQHSEPALNSLWEKRLIEFNQHTRIPDGYWCIFSMVAGYCFNDEFRGVHLIEDALPDGSVGKRWCAHLRERGFDMVLIRKYPHRYPDKRGVQFANIYPNTWLGEFWTWFHGEYLKSHYPQYLKTHVRSLPSPTRRMR